MRGTAERHGVGHSGSWQREQYSGAFDCAMVSRELHAVDVDMLPRVYIYPTAPLEREFGRLRTEVDQSFFERVVRVGLAPFSVADATAASLFFIPLPVGGTCGRSRRRAARVLYDSSAPPIHTSTPHSAIASQTTC